MMRKPYAAIRLVVVELEIDKVSLMARPLRNN
jgi:hypothetical protein